MSLPSSSISSLDISKCSNNPLMHFLTQYLNIVFYNYSLIKWKIKLRIKYRKAKTIYSGYYYFGMTDEQYAKYKANYRKNSKKMLFDKLHMYKILEECELRHE